MSYIAIEKCTCFLLLFFFYIPKSVSPDDSRIFFFVLFLHENMWALFRDLLHQASSNEPHDIC